MCRSTTPRTRNTQHAHRVAVGAEDGARDRDALAVREPERLGQPVGPAALERVRAPARAECDVEQLLDDGAHVEEEEQVVRVIPIYKAAMRSAREVSGEKKHDTTTRDSATCGGVCEGASTTKKDGLHDERTARNRRSVTAAMGARATRRDARSGRSCRAGSVAHLLREAREDFDLEAVAS